MRKSENEILSEFFSKKNILTQDEISSNDERSSIQIDRKLTPTLSSIYEICQKNIALQIKNNSSKDIPISTRAIQDLITKESEILGYSLSEYENDLLLSKLERIQNPMGILEKLFEDDSISDIIISSYDKIEYLRGRNVYLADLSFNSQQEYENYVEKILNKLGKNLSIKFPIVDAMINSQIRINAVHQSIAQGGPYLTFRINRMKNVSITDLVASNLAPPEVINYLAAAVSTGLTVLIAGEVGTGKTTLLRALASVINANESILVIEDTSEIMISHAHVRYLTSRLENSEGVGKLGPAECIRSGMRMAMSRIVFGEMRDSEAAEAFIDVCSSGHAGLSTIHAKCVEDALIRLELFLGRAQKGVAQEVFQQQVSTAVQVIVHLNFCKQTGKRRIMQVKELGRVSDGRIKQTPIFSYYYSNQALWRVEHRLSNYKDRLLEVMPQFSLSNLPDFLGFYGSASQFIQN